MRFLCCLIFKNLLLQEMYESIYPIAYGINQVA